MPYVNYKKIKAEISLLAILNEENFTVHKSTTQRSKAKVFERGHIKILYYNNPRGEYWMDANNPHIKGDVIEFLSHFCNVKKNEDILDYLENHYSEDEKFIETHSNVPQPKTFNPDYTLKPHSQVAKDNFLTAERKIDFATIDRHLKDTVAQSKKKFKGNANIIFPFYHLNKKDTLFIPQAQLIKNYNYSGFTKDCMKSISLWYAYLHFSATDLYIFEDPIDALSFEELYLKRVSNISYNLIATGGNPSISQFMQLMKYINHFDRRPKIHLAFDTDFSGLAYSFNLLNTFNLNHYFTIDFQLDKHNKQASFNIMPQKNTDELYYFCQKWGFYEQENRFRLPLDYEFEAIKFFLEDFTNYFFANDYAYKWARLNDFNDDLKALKNNTQS